MKEHDSPLKVLFITGFGRSGTTIVDNVLGQLDGFFSLGETQFVWDRSLRDNRLCGCGRPFRECEIWSRVCAAELDAIEPRELDEMVRLRDSLGPLRLLGRSLLGRRGVSPALERYIDRTRRLYRAVQRLTGSRVLIDSSKSPSHGYVLAHMPGIELKILHMVRNPRAVAHSWQRRKVYDSSGEEPMYMARLSVRKSSTMWLTWNLVSELLWRRHRGGYQLLRYEDFVDRPQGTVEGVLELLGEEQAGLPFTGSHTVQLGTNHCLAGNPNRFEQGPVEIRRDERWKERMRPLHQLAVAGLTWPLLARYGYLSPLVARAETPS